MPTLPIFARYIGIDYSGAETPTASLKGLRVFLAEGTSVPVEVLPLSRSKYWSRRGIVEWLVERLHESVPTVVGIDHAFSFPQSYFEAHGLQADWSFFLEDFQRHWPTNEDNVRVEDVRLGHAGNGAARMGDTRWRRLTEESAGGAKSVFHFDVQGSVAKSSHGGIPWLRHIRQQLGARVHFWPFDGWDIPAGRSAIVEVYPALWSHAFAVEGRTGDQHDAYSIVAWLSHADHNGTLSSYLNPVLDASERELAVFEGWILGVLNSDRRRRRSPTRRNFKPPSAVKRVERQDDKLCPECGHRFRGGTWGGIDAHWKSRHSHIMSYERAWPIIKSGRSPSAVTSGSKSADR